MRSSWRRRPGHGSEADEEQDGTAAVKLASASNLRKSSCQEAGTVQLVSSCNPRKSNYQEAGWYSGGEVGVGVQAKEAKLMRNRGGEVGVVV
ncbi:hypothetical protein PF002_g9154 [Phytophthora fragariae]|uniref:Uncharacterized protein n=1 Tax=Phytophthora fragariae TaxID=53985 RepID=A0A6A3ZUY1_9STRA|nr:hypothetical protein PF002_g9154 [Phytophthora fragariae]